MPFTARTQFINGKINDRLKSALSANESSGDDSPEQEEISTAESVNDTGIVTTEEEIEGYHIVKAILREVLDLKRVSMRDTKSYCGILLDDNNRKPICRFHFNTSQKYLGVFSEKKEERTAINSLNDIFEHADKLRAVIKEYDGPKMPNQSLNPTA